MIFNSVTFIVFLFCVVFLYWVLPRRPRLILLLLASVTFYGFWRFEYTFLMLASALNDYIVSLHIEKTKSFKRRKRLLYLSLFVNLGLLIYFKYLIFFAENAVGIINLFGGNIATPGFSIILPLGISFYTFQTISYTVDVYRGHIKPYKDFALYGSYVTFFPQLVAGPILRAPEVIEQLSVRKRFEINYFNKGILRVMIGLFLKVVIADNIAPIVDEIYAIDSLKISALDVWVKAFMFGFQIYFDFAAYSHIAIGAAFLMGISFPENFNYPYISTSFKEFWKRWHISLSSWIRDYLYLPLMGVKVIEKGSLGGIKIEKPKSTKSNIALFATWGIMGLWHGASWAFVFWGIYHAFLIFIERKVLNTKIISSKLHARIGWFVTFPLIMLGWLPFRENNLSDVFVMFKKVFLFENFLNRSYNENVYLICGLLVVLFLIAYFIENYLLSKVKKAVFLYATVLIVGMSIVSLLSLTFLRPISQFIYFQF